MIDFLLKNEFKRKLNKFAGRFYSVGFKATPRRSAPESHILNGRTRDLIQHGPDLSTLRTGQPKQDSQARTDSTGQPGQDAKKREGSKNMTARTEWFCVMHFAIISGNKRGRFACFVKQ